MKVKLAVSNQHNIEPQIYQPSVDLAQGGTETTQAEEKGRQPRPLPFLDRLEALHASRGQILTTRVVNWIPVDYEALWRIVQDLGGYQMTCGSQKWSHIARQLGLAHAGAKRKNSAGQRIKYVYEKVLLPFEKELLEAEGSHPAAAVQEDDESGEYVMATYKPRTNRKRRRQVIATAHGGKDKERGPSATAAAAEATDEEDLMNDQAHLTAAATNENHQIHHYISKSRPGQTLPLMPGSNANLNLAFPSVLEAAVAGSPAPPQGNTGGQEVRAVSEVPRDMGLTNVMASGAAFGDLHQAVKKARNEIEGLQGAGGSCSSALALAEIALGYFHEGMSIGNSERLNRLAAELPVHCIKVASTLVPVLSAEVQRLEKERRAGVAAVGATADMQMLNNMHQNPAFPPAQAQFIPRHGQQGGTAGGPAGGADNDEKDRFKQFQSLVDSEMQRMTAADPVGTCPVAGGVNTAPAGPSLPSQQASIPTWQGFQRGRDLVTWLFEPRPECGAKSVVEMELAVGNGKWDTSWRANNHMIIKKLYKLRPFWAMLCEKRDAIMRDPRQMNGLRFKEQMLKAVDVWEKELVEMKVLPNNGRSTVPKLINYCVDESKLRKAAAQAETATTAAREQGQI